MLDRLLEEELVCVNELILTELLPVLRHRRRQDVSESLSALERVPLKVSWEIIREYQEMNLQNGLNQVGIPDLIIIQQVIEEKITLFSFDKHFKLMNRFLKFDLLDS